MKTVYLLGLGLSTICEVVNDKLYSTVTTVDSVAGFCPYSRCCHLNLLTDQTYNIYIYRRYFQHAHFIPIVDVGKRGEY